MMSCVAIAGCPFTLQLSTAKLYEQQRTAPIDERYLIGRGFGLGLGVTEVPLVPGTLVPARAQGQETRVVAETIEASERIVSGHCTLTFGSTDIPGLSKCF